MEFVVKAYAHGGRYSSRCRRCLSPLLDVRCGPVADGRCLMPWWEGCHSPPAQDPSVPHGTPRG
ncbi:hypothetical protein E2C01_028748 [Portunus trituberculatus]|uniref:Uncharacterized protein n=1 Tax=Portunus trituberculatus TaxID=210409 RepID=A0A5B7EQ16_PORTR|nr:hypothetical protein [Portunus trituberculatus]